MELEVSSVASKTASDASGSRTDTASDDEESYQTGVMVVFAPISTVTLHSSLPLLFVTQNISCCFHSSILEHTVRTGQRFEA